MKKHCFTAITALALVICVFMGGCSKSEPESKTMLSVGGERISNAECNYYYVYYLSQNGIDLNTPEGLSMLSSSTGVEEFETFDDYFRYLVAREVQKTVLCLKEAEKAGWELPSQKGLDDTQEAMRQMQDECDKAGVKLDDYIHGMWGADISESDIRTVFERMYTARDYYTTVLEPQWIPTETDVLNYYNDNKAQYDKVDFRCLFLPYIKGDIKANEQTADRAEEMLSKIETEDDFITLSAEYAPLDEKAYAKSDEYTINRSVLKETLNEAPAKWLFDGARKPGDKTVVDDSRGVYVLYFISRRQPQESLVTVRQLSILSDATEGGAPAAKKKAEELLAQINSEEDIAKLVAENSTVKAEKENGGLYANVYLGGQPEVMEKWCFDKARKAGDKTVVQSEYGSHALYFVSRTDDAEWHNRCYNKLYTQRMQDAMSALRGAYPYSFL